jgi:sugar/nucleoside kinase (ribokinase family)
VRPGAGLLRRLCPSIQIQFDARDNFREQYAALVARPRFFAVGDLMLDVFASGRGHDARILVRPGGSSANAAIWANRCGADATVVGCVGDDLAGRALEHELGARGVRASFSVIHGERTGTTLDVDGHRRVDRGANALAASELLPDLPAADVVLVSGYLPLAAADAAISRAQASWVAVSDGVSGPPPAAQALFLPEERARALTDCDAETSAMMLGRHYRLVCVTRGREGAVATLDGQIEMARPTRVYTGDATGAGDAFAAATLVALAGGASLSEALREGCRCGALVASSSSAWPVS